MTFNILVPFFSLQPVNDLESSEYNEEEIKEKASKTPWESVSIS